MKSHQDNPHRIRNPFTKQRHRKEVFWQISVPIVIGGMILLVISFLSTRLVADETSRWADISSIWIIAPVIVLGFLSLVTLIAGIVAVVKLIQVLPNYSFRLQKSLMNVRTRLKRMADRSVEPVLRLGAFSAAAKKFSRRITRR